MKGKKPSPFVDPIICVDCKTDATQKRQKSGTNYIGCECAAIWLWIGGIERKADECA